jgi:hypothetical protein
MTDDLILVSQRLSDAELSLRIRQLARVESRLTALLVAHLAEFDSRRLYLGEGYSSLFAYCTGALHLSEQSTLNRIGAARLARRFPEVLKRLENQSIHLAGLRVLAPFMTSENHVRLLDMARYQSRRQIECLVEKECFGEGAGVVPVMAGSISPPMVGDLFDTSHSAVPVQEVVPGEDGMARQDDQAAPDRAATDLAATDPAVPRTPQPLNVIRQESLITPSPSAEKPCSPAPPLRKLRARTTRIAPGIFRLQVTLDAQTHTLLLQARELMLHQLPQGDLSRVIHHALDRLVRDLHRRKFGGSSGRNRKRKDDRRRSPEIEAPDGGCRQAVLHPNPGSSRRYIPTAVRRAVWTRDGGRCAFVSTDGHRCGEGGRLEFHHVTAFAQGGLATTENLQLRCRAHNQYEAEKEFGSVKAAGCPTRG